MKPTRKGQMEILGLAIVVLLMIFTLIFVVSSTFLRPSNDAISSSTGSVEATNYLSTLLNTQVAECGQLSVLELIQDCAKASEGVYSCSNGSKSCLWANHITQYVYGQTLDTRKITHEFRVSAANGVLSISSGTGCPGIGQSKTQPIPSTSGKLEATLKLC